MCVSDTGRVIAANTVMHTFTPGVASSLLLGPAQSRVAIMIGGVTNGRVTLSPGNPAVLDQGITIPQGLLPIILSSHDLKCLVHQPIFGIGSGATSTITLIEVFI